jgi:hypothetical protein
VTGYKGDVKELGQAEQYMREMAGFRGAPKRIRCMIYKQVRRHVCGACGANDNCCRFGRKCTWLILSDGNLSARIIGNPQFLPRGTLRTLSLQNGVAADVARACMYLYVFVM